MNKILIIVLIFSSSFLVAQTDYYIIGNKMVGGIVLIDGGNKTNHTICQVKNGEFIETYTPFQIREYGFKDGKTYKAFQVSKQDTSCRYYLEIVTSGKINLFFLKDSSGNKRYFLSKYGDSSLIELPKRKVDFRALLSSTLNDPKTINDVKYTSFRYFNLKRFISNYNKENKRLFPRFHYGFFLGRTASQYSFNESQLTFTTPQLDLTWNFTLGVFVDIPIYSSEFSFHPELFVKKNKFNVSYDTHYNNSYDFFVNNISFTMPLMFRYTILKKDNSPFFEVGPMFSHALYNKNAIYSYKMDSNTVTIKVRHDNIFQKTNAGISIGIGVLAHIHDRHSIFSEIRYNSYFGNSSIINVNELTFNFGIEL